MRCQILLEQLQLLKKVWLVNIPAGRKIGKKDFTSQVSVVALMFLFFRCSSFAQMLPVHEQAFIWSLRRQANQSHIQFKNERGCSTFRVNTTSSQGLPAAYLKGCATFCSGSDLAACREPNATVRWTAVHMHRTTAMEPPVLRSGAMVIVSSAIEYPSHMKDLESICILITTQNFYDSIHIGN